MNDRQGAGGRHPGERARPEALATAGWLAALGIALVLQAVSVAAGPADPQLAAPADPIRATVSSEDPRESYIAALRLLAHGEGEAARTALVTMERSALARGDPSSLLRLLNLETVAATGLAARTPDALVPVLLLHHDVFVAGTAKHENLLVVHAAAIASRLAAVLARHSTSPEQRAFAAAVLSSLADTEQSQSAHAMALTLFRRALAIDEHYAPAALGAAALQEWRGRYDDAVKLLAPLADVQPEQWEATLRLAVNLARIGKISRARELFRRCLTPAAPEWIRTVSYEELARSYVAAGSAEEAVRLLREARRLLPDEAKIEVMLALALERGGDAVEAEGVARRLLERPPVDRESPRMRYGRWPDEVFVKARAGLHDVAAGYVPALARALDVATGEQG